MYRTVLGLCVASALGSAHAADTVIVEGTREADYKKADSSHSKLTWVASSA
jgi:hypothetical protein